jgi:methionyl aminopeptidase
MSISSDADWAGLREVARIVRLTLDELERHARPGVATKALDRLAARISAEHGARSAPAVERQFPGHVLISVNDEAVHGVPGRRELRMGDLVKLDVTLSKNGYVADAARSIVIGEANDRAVRLKVCAEAALEAALHVARAGNRVNEIGRTIERVVRRRGFMVVRALTGHGVGRAIHEPPSVPNYCDIWQTDVLTEGLVLAIEPIIAAGS